MRFVHQCLKFSVTLLKINFTVVILLQLIKFLVNDDEKKLFFRSGTHGQLRDLSKDNSILSSSDNSNVNTLYSYWYSPSAGRIEATRTEIVRYKGEEAEVEPSYQYEIVAVVRTTCINFTELFKYNSVKHAVKLALVLNLNLTCMLLCLLMVSFFRSAASQKAHKSFYNTHMSLNMALILFVASVNSIYLLAWRLKNHAAAANSNNSSSSSSFLSSLDMQCFSRRVLIVNFVTMLLSIGLLVYYSYLFKYFHIEEKEDIEEDDEEERKTITIEMLLCSVTFHSNEEEESEAEPSAKVVKKDLVSPRKKLESRACFELQWILHSLFAIYLLNIWNIADVYRFIQFKANSEQQQLLLRPSANSLLNSNEFLISSLIKANALLPPRLEQSSSSRLVKYELLYYKNSRYTNKYASYKMVSVYQRRQRECLSSLLEHKRAENELLYRSLERTRTLYMMRRHFQLLANTLVISFAVLILFKLSTFRSLCRSMMRSQQVTVKKEQQFLSSDDLLRRHGLPPPKYYPNPIRIV